MSTIILEISEGTKNAIRNIASDCAADMTNRDARSKSIMAETVLDANRLKFFGYPLADDEIARLINRHGYKAVHKTVMEFVPTY